MKNYFEKSEIILILGLAICCGFFGALLAPIDGLSPIIFPICIVALTETFFSTIFAFGGDIEHAWKGWLFHLVAGLVFWASCSSFGIPVLEPFEYEADLGNERFAFVTQSANSWYWIIIPILCRVVIVQPILVAIVKIKEKAR